MYMLRRHKGIQVFQTKIKKKSAQWVHSMLRFDLQSVLSSKIMFYITLLPHHALSSLTASTLDAHLCTRLKVGIHNGPLTSSGVSLNVYSCTYRKCVLGRRLPCFCFFYLKRCLNFRTTIAEHNWSHSTRAFSNLYFNGVWMFIA